MAGYADDWSMSNNAVAAYERGLRPTPNGTSATSLTRSPPTSAQPYTSTTTRSRSCVNTS